MTEIVMTSDSNQIMDFLNLGGKDIPVNKDGFLVNFDDWSEDIAKDMAAAENLELTACHWLTINFLRDYFSEFEVPPSPRIVKKEIGDKISAWGCTNKTLEKAFPLGGCKQACRLAGLPAHYCNAC